MRLALKIAGAFIVALILIGIGSAIGAASHTKTVTVNHTRTITAQAAPAPTVTVTITAKPKSAGATMPGDGTFAVGTTAGDWPPGTWKTSGAVGGNLGNCYWATLSNLSGSDSSILANNDDTGPVVITVGPGVAGVQVNGCNTWQKIG